MSVYVNADHIVECINDARQNTRRMTVNGWKPAEKQSNGNGSCNGVSAITRRDF